MSVEILKERKLEVAELTKILASEIGHLEEGAQLIDLGAGLDLTPGENAALLFAVTADNMVIVGHTAGEAGAIICQTLAAASWLQKNRRLMQGYLESKHITTAMKIKICFVAPRFSDEFKEAIKCLGVPVSLVGFRCLQNNTARGIFFDRLETFVPKIAPLPSLTRADKMEGALTPEEEAEFVNFGQMLNL